MTSSMNMTGLNPAQGGPVGGGMMMMNNGAPATPSNNESDNMKLRLNTYIYDYFLNFGYHDHARALVHDGKFELSTKPPLKSSPGGRRKDGEINGVDENAMDTDSKDELTLIPDDLPRPQVPNECPGSAFLFDWFCLFHDIFRANAQRAKNRGQRDGTPAQTYLEQTQQMQRMRETQQTAQLMRNPQLMAGQNQFAGMRGMRNGMSQNDMRAAAMSKMTPQQLHQFSQHQMMKQQHQMQREHSDMDMNGHRPQSPSDPENPGSPSKRPRLGEQPFNGQMGPNGRGQGMPGVGPQGNGMLMQTGINQKPMGQGQFQGFAGQNPAMQQKLMQGAMQNGMMGPNVMANQGSPMMQPMSDTQFMGNMPMGDIYSSRMGANGAMQGPGAAAGGNHALQDYQMQLMLLEQQNKKRLMMARQEQDNISRDPSMPGQPGMNPPGMSPSGSRTGTSPNPSEQMKRTPGLGGSPAPGDLMQGRGSTPPIGFIGGTSQDFSNSLLTRNGIDGMPGPGGHGMRPGPNLNMEVMARAQQGNKMPGGNWQGGPQGPQMMQPQNQGQPPPMGTPGQRGDMPPPQAPATGSANANRTQPSQPSSPQPGPAPPTPSQSNKPAPKKKAKEDTRKRQNKKGSTTNAPTASEPDRPPTPTPSTPITPVHPSTFGNNGKGGLATTAGGATNANPAPTSNPSVPQNQQQIPPQEPIPGAAQFPDHNFPDQAFNLDFSGLESADVLNDFDFDSFLNNTDDPTNWQLDPNLGSETFGMETAGVE